MRLIRCRGIGENPTGTGTMLAGVTAGLSGYEIVEAPWAADYGPVGNGVLGSDYDDSLARGLPMVLSLLDGGPAIVLGYSGGAELARQVGEHGHQNLRGLGLIADPSMPPGCGVPGKYGVTGHSYALPNVPICWVYNPNDVICQCPSDSPIRTISDITGEFGVDNFPAWSWDLVDRLIARRWQVLGRYFFDSPITQYRRLSAAIIDATGYLNGSQHVTAYHGAKQEELAEWVRGLGVV